MDWKNKWNDKEVTSPLGRFLVALIMIVALVVLIPIIILMIVALVILTPILIPLHFILRAVGRRGFATRKPNGAFSIKVDADAFKRIS